MDETVASRLKLFIDTNGLTSTQFADMCGIPRPSLSQILSGRNKKISDILVGQIHRAFPDLSVVWLLFGEGPVKTGNVRSMSAGFSVNDSPGDSSTADPQDYPGNSSTDYLSASGKVGGSPESSLKSVVQKLTDRPLGKVANENLNLRGLNGGENAGKLSENQVFESDLKILDLTRQIEQMRQNPRKVLQITIYYDDSTFETFVPK